MSSPRRAGVRGFAVASLCFGVVGLAASGARAEPPRDAMNNALVSYYAGEKAEALIFLGTGVFSIGLGSFLVTRDSLFARGAGYPTLAVGVLQTIFAASYHAGIDGKVDDLKKQIDKDPAAHRTKEIDRIAGVNRRFVIFRYAELGIIATGAALSTVGFVKKIDVLKGLGIGLGVEAALFLSLDFFAERRAHQYRDKLESVPVAFSIDPSQPRNFQLSFNRSF
jgi:hypothetical protein